jgi:hypothetical protein
MTDSERRKQIVLLLLEEGLDLARTVLQRCEVCDRKVVPGQRLCAWHLWGRVCRN